MQGNVAFIAAYMYDVGGNAVWYASGPAALTGNYTYHDNWTTYTGGQTLTGTYQAVRYGRLRQLHHSNHITHRGHAYAAGRPADFDPATHLLTGRPTQNKKASREASVSCIDSAAAYFFAGATGAAGGAGAAGAAGAGGVSWFQVSRRYSHLPSFLRETLRNLPVSTTAPLTVAL